MGVSTARRSGSIPAIRSMRPIGLDANGDSDNTDRPVKGVDDRTKPILSAVDQRMASRRNGIPARTRQSSTSGCSTSSG
jgi:hypothetical protein